MCYAFICLYSGSACLGQTFRIGNVLTLEGTAFDPQSKRVFAIWKDSLRVFSPPNYTESHLIRTEGPIDFPLGYLPVASESTMYFVHKAGGLVYKMEGDSLRRIDRSFNHKMQINSTIFVRNDSIMRYGGYGFWSERNFFTYFSPRSNEWEILSPSGSDQLPRGAQYGRVVQSGEHIYVFSGVSTDPFEPLEFKDFREVWRFDVKNRSWERLGNISQDFHNYTEVLHLGDKILYGVPNKTQFVLVDPADNKLTYYDITPGRRDIYVSSEKTNDIRSFYDEGKIYLIRKFNPDNTFNWDGALVCTVMDAADFLGAPLYTEAMYSNDNQYLKWVGGILATTGCILLFFIGRKRYLEKDKIKVSRKGVRYKGRKVVLDQSSIDILNLLLRSGDAIPSQKILDLAENPSQSAAHNIRVKNQLIENLNLLFKTLLGIDEDLIQSAKSPDDRRIRTYQIRPHYFKVQ